jgi:hypothetical protein
LKKRAGGIDSILRRQTMSTKKTDRPAPSPDGMREEIRMMAQSIYSERQTKKLPGDELSDWLAAERKVKTKHKL